MSRLGRDVEGQIEALLEKGLTKAEIQERLKDLDADGEVEFYLKNVPYPEDKRRYMLANVALFALLLVVTLKKLYFALSFGGISIAMLAAMVVPTVNIWLLYEIRRFRGIGYKFTAILSTLSLINAENRAWPEVVMIPAIIALSAFLYWKMFYKKWEQKA